MKRAKACMMGKPWNRNRDNNTKIIRKEYGKYDFYLVYYSLNRSRAIY